MDGTLEKRKAWNPRFVLRQWVLEDIIKKVEGREEGCREGLNKILKVSLRIFDPTRLSLVLSNERGGMNERRADPVWPRSRADVSVAIRVLGKGGSRVGGGVE